MQNPWPNFIKCKLHSICRTVSFNFTDETTINALHCSLKISYYLEKKIAFQMLSKSLHTCSIFYSTTCKGIPFFFNTLKWVYLDLRLFCLGFLCICVIQSFIILIFTFYVPLQVKWKKKTPTEFIAAWKVISPVCVYFRNRNENCNYNIRLKPTGSSCKFKRVNAHVICEMFVS